MIDSDPPPSTPPLSESSVRPMPGLVAAGWVFGVVLIQILLYSVVHRPGEQADLVSGFACQTIAYLLGLFLILRVHAPAKSVRALLGARTTHPAFYPIAILLAVALTPPLDALFEAIQRRYPEQKQEEGYRFYELLTSASTPKLVLLGVIIIIIGPILEEIFFRGALFKPIERGYAASRSIAVGITAVLFATAHLDHQELIPLFFIGLTLGFLRQTSGSLLPPALLHMTFNGIALYATLTTAHGAELAAPPLSRWIIAASSALALGLLGLTYFIGTRTQAAAHAQELDRQ